MTEHSPKAADRAAPRARRTWTSPQLTVMAAGSAELAVGVADDGADES